MKTPNSLPRNQSLAWLARSGWFVLAAVAFVCLSLPLRADLVAHWKFDEVGGTVANDAVGSFPGTLSVSGAAFVGGGVSGNAISLNRASGGFVNMGDVLPLTSGDFSIVTWVKMNPGDTSPDTILLGKHQAGTPNGYFLLANQSGGGGQNNKATFYGGGVVAQGALSQTSINDGNWHQVVGVYRSGMNKVIYVNGVAESTNTAPAIGGNTAPFLVGGIGESGAFTGLLDDIQVYNHALNPDDVAYLFQNPGEVITPPPPSVAPIAHWKFDEAGGNVANDAVGSFHGTLSVSGAAFVGGGVSGNAISLNRASGGFVNMDDVLPLTSGDFSIVAWVKMNPGDTTPDTILLGKHQAGTLNGYFLLVNQSGGGGQNNKATFYAGGLVSAGAVSQTSINDGNWHQVVGVYRSGMNKVIYVNGVAESTNTAPAISGNTAPFLVGGVSQSGAFTGLLDDIQVYNHALNPEDVAYLFQNPGQVLPAPPPCLPPPASMVGWWKGDDNLLDEVNGNHGSLVGNATYGTGLVGGTFNFDGDSDAVLVGNPSALQLQNFTIEAWVKRASTEKVSSFPGADGLIFGYGTGGYGFGLDRESGRPFLSHIRASVVIANTSVADTNFHHLAVTKSGGTVVFYVDGVAHAVPEYAPTFTFTTPAAIGAAGDLFDAAFYGSVDELAIYSRALSTAEIQAIFDAGGKGKCPAFTKPSIASHPASQTVVPGANVTFSVTASGTAPLSYQWRRNGIHLEGATGSSLTLTNVQLADAGSYSVVVTNAAGTATSSDATLTVNLPPAAIIVSSANAASASTVTLPVLLVANGNENALGFSLNFNPALLSYGRVTLGSGAVGASLLVNTNQLESGRIGLALALPTDTTFPVGNQEALRLEFTTAIVTEDTETTITLGDVPISRQVSDAPGNPLAATYANGTVVIGAVTYEGDVAPRPDGDRNVTITDWVLAGRYASRLDYPTNAAEFQRADSAPRATLGDGVITVIDWVQAGRYAAALDPLTPVGGPSAEVGEGLAAGGVVRQAGDDEGPGRQLQVAEGLLLRDQSVTLGVSLQAMGDENALGFSVSFDPAILSFAGAVPGTGAVGTTLHVNSQQAGTGRLGLVLALASGNTFSAGTAELAKLTFNAATPASTNCLVKLVDQPVPRQISDANALPLSATYRDATITVNPLPVLRIVQVEQDIVLSWPLWASNYTLQESSGTLSPPAWTAVEEEPNTGPGEHQLTQPLTGDGKFFRLIAQ